MCSRTLLLLATEITLDVALGSWDLGIHLLPPNMDSFEIMDTALGKLILLEHCSRQGMS